MHLILFSGRVHNAAPVFLARPKNTKAYGLGSEVTLECAASGHPKPEIMWLKDGSSVDLNHLDSRFTRLGSGSLNAKDKRLEDTTNFNCMAILSEDAFDAAASLEILRPLKFLKRPVNKVALQKGDIKLECKVKGQSHPTVQWYKSGDLILKVRHVKRTSLC